MACMKNEHDMSGFIDTFSCLLFYSYKSYSLSGYMHALLKTTSMAMKKILEELYSIVKNWENDGCHKNCHLHDDFVEQGT